MHSGSNSSTIANSLFERAREHIARARHADAESLEHYRKAGAEFRQAKAILRHGEFGRIVAESGLSRAWVARLMRLDACWSEFKRALVWANDTKRAVQFSVDGALRLIKEHHATMNAAGAGGGRAKRTRRSAETEQKSKPDSETQWKLAAAKARIRYLEDTPVVVDTTMDRAPIDKEIVERIRKVAALWLRGSTDGERLGAVGRIDAMARRLGWRFRDLTAAAGIEL